MPNDATALNKVINTPNEAVKFWYAFTGLVVAGALWMGYMTFNVDQLVKAQENTTRNVDLLTDNQNMIMNMQDNHDKYGEHRDSRPDIERIDRILLEWEIRDSLRKESPVRQ